MFPPVFAGFCACCSYTGVLRCLSAPHIFISTSCHPTQEDTAERAALLCDFLRVTKKEEGLGVRTWFTLRSRGPFHFPLWDKAGSGVSEGASKTLRNYGFSDSITHESISSRVIPPSVHPTKNISDCLLPVWVPGI